MKKYFRKLPMRAMGKMIRGIDESIPNEAIKNWPMTMTIEPNVQSARDPRRSESHPATGATNTMTTELATMIQPICVGLKWRMFCR